MATVLADTKTVRDDYLNKISPLEQTAINSASSTITELEKLLNYNAQSIDLVIDNLENYADLINQSKETLVKSRIRKKDKIVIG